MTGILKKLDRAMSNEEFIKQFPNAHAKFLSYIISDHTPWTSQPVQSIDTSDNLFRMKLSEENASNMVRDVVDDEMKIALFDFDDSKALGLDGFSVAFFKKSWCIIGKDICCAIREFFIPRKLLGELNAILVSLIPKVPIPNKVTDLRPIACCNVLYRCISKVITNRIKPVLRCL
ncbi:hypothetical protein Tco_0984621, partial [Tanacetum coccineum]